MTAAAEGPILSEKKIMTAAGEGPICAAKLSFRNYITYVRCNNDV